jgi:DNA polymerase-3 subunit alpha
MPAIRLGESVNFVGIVTKVRKIYTKKTGKPMAFITMEDQSGSVSVVVFPGTYDACKEYLEEDEVLLVNGSVSEDNDGTFSIAADNIVSADSLTKNVWISITDAALYENSKEWLVSFTRAHPGEDSIKLLLNLNGETRKAMLQDKILGTEENLQSLRKRFGEKQVALGKIDIRRKPSQNKGW